MRGTEKIMNYLASIQNEPRSFSAWEVMEASGASGTSVRRILKALKETGHLRKLNKRAYAYRVWSFSEKSKSMSAECLYDAYTIWRHFTKTKVARFTA